MVANLITDQLNRLDIEVSNICQFWLHQANANMCRVIMTRILGTSDYDPNIAPMILNEYVFDAANPVSFTEAVVGAPPSTIPGRTGAVVVVAKVASVPYSKLNEVGAYPGFTSIKTSAV